jgi:hypothetical protein
MRYIVLVSDDLHLEAFRAKIREQAPEAEQAAMTIAEQLRREGEARGQAKLLKKLLRLKFGPLTAEHEKVIVDATAEQLEQYGERVLEAESIDDVFGE